MIIPKGALLVSIGGEPPVRDLAPDLHRCDECGNIWKRKDLAPFEDLAVLTEGALTPSGRCPEEDCAGVTFPLAPIPHHMKVWTCAQCGEPLDLDGNLTAALQEIDTDTPAKAAERISWILSLWHDPCGRCPTCQETPVPVSVLQTPDEPPRKTYRARIELTGIEADTPEWAAKLSTVKLQALYTRNQLPVVVEEITEGLTAGDPETFLV